uniref:Tudor domain-containing protein n=1 Tax=Clastoptera arizonana TaxID=38151 RepID=A0A1B6CR68_9HEMI
MRPIAPARKPFIKEAWIPPLISRRRPQKVPLSITLNNNNQGNSSKNSRMVMVGAGHYSPPTSPVQASYPTSKPKHNLPPRLQKKTFSQEFSANLLSHPLNVDTDYASEARGKNFDSPLFPAPISENSAPLRDKTITTPFSPSLAVACGRAKAEAEELEILKKNYGEPTEEAEELQNLRKNYAEPTEEEKLNLPRSRHDYLTQNRLQKGMTNNWRALQLNEFCEKLKNYSLKNGWPDPIYKIFPRTEKYVEVFTCTVKFGTDQCVSTYPNEYKIPEMAREMAAKGACEKIDKMEEDALRNSYKITEDINEMCERMSKIVNPHPNGVWADSVLKTYQTTHGENPPEGWVNMFATSPTVIATRVSDDRVIFTPNTASLNTVLSAPIKHEETLQMPDLVMPAEIQWSVYITSVNSVTEIWARLIGDDYSAKFENMTTEMEMHYLNISAKEIVLNPQVNNFYAAPFEDTWFRVHVKDIVNGKAICWLIDHGEYEEFHVEKLFKLDKKFYSLPKQIFRCQLFGLEDYADEKILTNLMIEMLPGKIFVANIESRDTSKDIITLVLYDTSTDEDVNVNEKLTTTLLIEASKDQLPAEGSLKEVYVIHISSKGEVFVQVRGTVYNYLIKMLDELDSKIIEENRVKSLSELVLNKLYIAQYEYGGDKRWHRVIILDSQIMTNKVSVKYVDWGNSHIVNVHDLVDIGSTPSLLSHLPHQAIMVHLDNVLPESINDEKVKRIISLLSYEEQVLIKVVSLKGKVPIVEIFKRQYPGALLGSINNTIAFDPQINKSQEVAKPKVLAQKTNPGKVLGKRLPVRALQPPDTPNYSSESFNIFVSMSASPSNFSIQPRDYNEGLQKMKKEMNDFYNTHSTPLKNNDIKEGELYAVCKEGNWYRAILIKFIEYADACVYFCDYGNVTSVNFSEMRELQPKFKILPYLAVKAKLYGIAPRHSDWSVEDCLRFQNLVCDKVLTSYVMDIVPDVLNTSDSVLSLKIMDKDVDIADLLISEGCAIKIYD